MGKSKARDLGIIPIVPMTLECPFCTARPNRPCKTTGGRDLGYVLGSRVRLIHVARIEKAAQADRANKATRKRLLPTS
jgi:hypothetical protein